jgi:cyclase
VTRPHTAEVADGVFAYIQPEGGWCVSNAGILLGGSSVTLVDSAATEARARALRSAVAELTPVAPGVVVNTHHHGDHTFGNGVAAPGATVIGHALTRSEMVEKGFGLRAVWPGVDWGETPLVPPDVTFTGGLTLHVGDRPVELIHVGPAHTTNDVVAWLPADGVLFAGDVLMPGCTPFILMGSLAGSLRAVERLRALGAHTIVCGHGPVCGPEVFDDCEEYLRWIGEIAADAYARGLDPLTAARGAELGPYAKLRDSERLVANLHRACAELAGRPPGAHLPSAPVFAEMVAYHGGQPLTCLA